jgi:hypothetical protein
VCTLPLQEHIREMQADRLAAGLKIGTHFAPEMDGVSMSNVMNAVCSGVTGRIMDVTDERGGEHVEIFVE